MEPRNGTVARDSQGRLRTEWNEGKFMVQNGAAAGTEVEQHRITICDPVKGESIYLDTLYKTAMIIRRTVSEAPSKTRPSHVWLPNFCAAQFQIPPNVSETEVQDLGHRAVQGIDAVGVLQKRAPQTTTNAAGNSSLRLRTVVTEVWCSEELGAIILRTIGTEEKGDSQNYALVNIRRGEPDASLFQVPPDYRVVERVNEPSAHQGLVYSQGFVASPAESAAPAPKP